MRREVVDVYDYADVPYVIAAVTEDVMAEVSNIDYSDAMWSMSGMLSEIHQSYFRQQGGPEGPWKPITPAWAKRKGHSKILLWKGPLVASLSGGGASVFNPEAVRDVSQSGNSTTLTWGTAVPYAAHHQTGTSRMPARPMVGVTETDATRLAELIANYIMDSLR